MAKDITTRVGVDDRASRKLDKAARSVTKYGRTWRTTARVTQRAMRVMDRAFARLGRGMRTLMRRAKFMLIGLQLTATIMGTQMVRSAMKYERALRNVTSLMAGAGMGQAEIEKNFRRMDGAIRRMSVRLGQAPDDLAAGMYNVVSATFDGESALKVLETAATGALAGLSDTNTVTGLLTKTLQAYRKEGESNVEVARKSTDVMDTYFMGVNRGMFTFDELAAKMGALPSTAAAFGVSLQDLVGFLSTATIRGMSLDEAITGVRQAMIQIGKTTPQTEAAAKELFGPKWKEVWSAQALAANGLYGTIENLNEVLPEIPANIMEAAIAMEDEGGDAFGFIAEKTGESVEAIAALFPNIRALKAIMAVSGPGFALYGENMEFMGERAGATQRALSEMEKSGALAMDKFKAMISVIGLDVGGLVLPILTEWGNAAVGWYEDLPNEFAKAKGLEETDLMRTLARAGEGDIFGGIAQKMWDEASPGERLGFTLRTAWSDAIANLTSWFNEGGGKQKVEGLGNAIGTGVANTLRALAGLDMADATDSLPAQFGKAFVEGFTKAFEDMDWVAFFQSTFGTALSVVLGGMLGGPGGALGAGAGAQMGGNPLVTGILGMLAWKGGGSLLGRILGGGGGGAAGGAGGGVAGGAGTAAGAAGGGIIRQLLGKAAPGALLTVMGSSAAGTVAQVLAGGAPLALLGLGTYMAMTGRMDSTPDLMGSPEATRRKVEGFQEAYDRTGIMPSEAFMGRGVVGTTNVPGVGPVPNANAYGGGINMEAIQESFEGKVWDPVTSKFVEASDTAEDAAVKQERAALRYNNAVSRFGGWVAALPPAVGVAIGGEDSSTNPGNWQGGPQQARGGSGMVYSPTTFRAGEAGPEHYEFTPAGKGRPMTHGGGGVVANISITEAGNPRQTAAYVVRELEKAIGNG